MAFQSAAFFALLVACLLVYHAVSARAKPVVLLVASCVFYASAGVGYCLLLAAAVLLSYTAGHLLQRAQSVRARRALLCAALVVLLGNLCFFKYYNFFGRAMNHTLAGWGVPVLLPDYGLLAPLGISFYTFVIVGYLIDVARQKQPAARNLLHYAVFVVFFPLIASGPIERANSMLPQLAQPRAFCYNEFARGTSRMLWGFFKKFVVADTVALYVNRVFAEPQAHTGPYLLLACLAFSYQLYCDFAGYSDIAIGAAQTLGLRVRENFARPFAARSFPDLWRRWHISLTTWLRDYLYIPLGGNRKGVSRAYLNQLLVFAVSGLWHGATVGFFIWGVLNGVYLLLAKATAAPRAVLAQKNPLYRNRFCKAFLQIACCYLLFSSCIVFFRAPTLQAAFAVYAGLGRGWLAALTNPLQAVLTLKGILSGTSLVLLAVCIPCLEWVEWRAARAGCTVGAWLQSRRLWVRVPVYYALLLALAFFGVLGTSSFIYFQF